MRCGAKPTWPQRTKCFARRSATTSAALSLRSTNWESSQNSEAEPLLAWVEVRDRASPCAWLFFLNGESPMTFPAKNTTLKTAASIQAYLEVDHSMDGSYFHSARSLGCLSFGKVIEIFGRAFFKIEVRRWQHLHARQCRSLLPSYGFAVRPATVERAT
jgi:hypothetical protein